MRLNKLTLFSLILVVLMSCFSICNAQGTDLSETESYGLAYALNITNKKDEKKTVTRGDAAGIVLRMLGFSESDLQNGEVFDDVSTDDDNGSEIYTAYRLGIISGVEGASFEPDENITYEQLAKMLVTALGYKQKAEDMGGYPMGYVVTAASLGINKNVEIENHNKLDVKTVSHIAENALKAEAVIYDNNKYYPDGTLLHKAFKLTKYTGVVTAVYGKSYTPHSYALNDGEVYINDILYEVGDFDIQGLLGYQVDFYVNDEADEPQTIVYAEKRKSDELVLELNNITDVALDRKGMYISYYESADSSRSSKEELYFDKTSLIYNGYYTDITKSDKDLFNFSDGSVKLIDYDNNGSWDFLIVERITSAVVKTYSTTTKTLTLEYPVELGAASVQKINFEDYDLVFFEGTLDYSNIKPGNVIDIRIPKNGVFSEKVIMMSASDRVMRSEISGKWNENGKNYLKINENTYELGDDYKNYSSAVYEGLQFGVEYTFYLTKSGKIAYIVNHLGEERVYGYLTNVYFDSEDAVRMKVLMDDGRFHHLEFADKVRVYRDGTDCGYQTSKKATEHLFVGGKFDINKAQLVRFLPDRDSVVRVIEFADNELGADAASAGCQNGSFIKSRSKFEGYYFHISHIVYTRSGMTPEFAFPATAVCFTVPTNPEDLADEDNFSVGGYTGQRGNITVDTYNDDEAGIPEIFVNYGGVNKYENFVYHSSAIVVKNTGKCVDRNNDVCDMMVDISGKIYYAKPEDNVFTDKSTGEPLKCGDVVQIVQTRGGYVKYIDILFFIDENAPNGYGYTYTDPGKPTRNTADKIVAAGGIDSDRIVAAGHLKSLTSKYLTISNDAGERAVFGRNTTNIKLYTVYLNQNMVTEETIDQLNIGDYVMVKCAQSNLKEVVRYVY